MSCLCSVRLATYYDYIGVRVSKCVRADMVGGHDER